jgi:chromosomal replication initiation ATPase DnaA
MAVGHREDLYRLRDQRFLGDEGFVDRVIGEREDEPSYIYAISIQELVGRVSTVFGIPMETVCSRSRNREGALGRGIVGYVGKKLCGYSNKSLAWYFHRDPVAMSRGIAKVEGRIRSDKDFEAKLRKLEEVITLGQKRKIRN